MKDKISIVIPIYNVEAYLKKCVYSVINQTYKNIEIFLVNDGSTDKSGMICDELKQIDNRIEVIHKKNGGLSDARNSAIPKCTGKYITFIDSDDYVDLDYVETLYNLVKKYNADISCVNYKRVLDNGDLIDKISTNEVYEFTPKDAIENMLYMTKVSNSAWGKLYKRELFNNILYPYGRLYEDLATTYKLFYLSNKIVSSSVQKYFYLIRNESIMNMNFSEKKLESLLYANEIYDFVCERMPSIKKSAISRISSEAVGLIRQIPDNEQYKNLKLEVWSYIKKYRKFVICDKKSTLKLKLNLMISYLGLSFYSKLLIGR